MEYEEFMRIMDKQVVPALGCTEPIAVALAAAKARQALACNPKEIHIFASRNIIKNGMGVGIPGTGMKGLYIAAALGAVEGNPDAELEVLKGISEEGISKAKEMVNMKMVHIQLKETDEKLFIEACCKSENKESKVIIKGNHTNVIFIEVNGKKVFDKTFEANESNKQNIKLSIKEIYEFADTVPFNKIKFLLKGVEMNKNISREGLKGDYGLQVGKKIYESIKSGLLSEDLQSYAMSVTAAAVDARMAGCVYPVMSNSGSGNQGLAASLPVIAVAERLDKNEEKLCRALVISHLITIHIKSFTGVLSPLCGSEIAGIGASCGITYLLGGEYKNLCYAIKNMIGDISGIICDGAKNGCALKISTSVSAALQSAILAISGFEVSENDGIIDCDVEKTIRNLASIGTEGMIATDKVILNIMTCK